MPSFFQRWPGLCLAILALSGAAVAAEANAKPSFAGTWRVDLKASDTGDAILEAQGRSKLERMAAKNMSVTQRISQTDTEITIVVDSALTKRSETLRLDGTPETKQTEKVGTVTTASQWDSDGKTLVTRVKMTLADGSPGDIVIRRSLRDEGRTMWQETELRKQNGEVLTAKRVFRKS